MCETLIIDDRPASAETVNEVSDVLASERPLSPDAIKIAAELKRKYAGEISDDDAARR